MTHVYVKVFMYVLYTHMEGDERETPVHHISKSDEDPKRGEWSVTQDYIPD